MAFFATEVGERGVGLYLQRTRAKYSLRFAKIRAKSELRLKRPIIGSQKGFQGSPKSISSKAPTIPLYTYISWRVHLLLSKLLEVKHLWNTFDLTCKRPIVICPWIGSWLIEKVCVLFMVFINLLFNSHKNIQTFVSASFKLG